MVMADKSIQRKVLNSEIHFPEGKEQFQATNKWTTSLESLEWFKLVGCNSYHSSQVITGRHCFREYILSNWW